MLRELPFYDELSIVKASKAFKGYARSYNIEIDSKDPLIQLTTSKPRIEDLFNDLLKEIKGFKYQITLKVLLSKYKENRDIELVPVYFKYIIKTIINFKYDFDKSFPEILYRIDNSISEGCGRITESIDAEYINISVNMLIFPLSESSYIQ